MSMLFDGFVRLHIKSLVMKFLKYRIPMSREINGSQYRRLSRRGSQIVGVSSSEGRLYNIRLVVYTRHLRGRIYRVIRKINTISKPTASTFCKYNFEHKHIPLPGI